MKGHRRSHQNTAFDLKTDFDNIKDALSEATQDVKGRMSEILGQSMDELRDRSTDIQDVVSDYVSHKPFKSIGLAMLSGFVLGFLLPRK